MMISNIIAIAPKIAGEDKGIAGFRSINEGDNVLRNIPITNADANAGSAFFENMPIIFRQVF